MTTRLLIIGMLLGFCGPGTEVRAQGSSQYLVTNDASAFDRFGQVLAFDPGVLVVGSAGWEPSPEFQDVGAINVLETLGSLKKWVQIGQRTLDSNPHSGDITPFSGWHSRRHRTESRSVLRLREFKVLWVVAFGALPFGSSGWLELQRLRASGIQVDDRFGGSVAISGVTLVGGVDRS